jgi:hypothetical protein
MRYVRRGGVGYTALGYMQGGAEMVMFLSFWVGVDRVLQPDAF